MAFNSLQSAFTYIIAFNPGEVDSLFFVLLAARCSGEGSGSRHTEVQILAATLPAIQPQTMGFRSPGLLFLPWKMGNDFYYL